MNDLRFGARMLARNPGSTFAMAVMLAVGIGAGTVIFSVVDALLLRRLPVRDPESLVQARTAHSADRHARRIPFRLL